jgi:hypothetical protein
MIHKENHSKPRVYAHNALVPGVGNIQTDEREDKEDNRDSTNTSGGTRTGHCMTVKGSTIGTRRNEHVSENATVTWADVVKGVTAIDRKGGTGTTKIDHSLETIQSTNCKFN